MVIIDYGKQKVCNPVNRIAKRWRLLLILILLFIGFRTGSPAAAGREYGIKAAFLLNFAKFIEWPPESLATPDVPVVFGILGSDSFGDALDLLEQKRIKGREIEIRRFKDPAAATGCHILFVSNSEKDVINDIIRILAGKAVLTVGETAQFARKGGIINFITVKNKIRFEINITAADRANLKISSKLLKLARIIEKESN